MRALHTAATGMAAQELNVQVISNNIANMRTTGYKRQRAEFQDLLYEHVSRIGTQTTTQGNILPVGIDLGGGVRTVGTPRIMTQGTLLPTGVETLRLLLTALSQARACDPVARRLRLHFVGTSNQSAPDRLRVARPSTPSPRYGKLCDVTGLGKNASSLSGKGVSASARL